MNKTTQKTKIIFTIGPATESEETIEALINEGADICRINMAHANHEWTETIVNKVRKVCKQAGRHIAIMMDVKGPEVRTGDVPETFHLEKDEIFYFTYGEGEGGKNSSGHRRVDVNYPDFYRDISIGNTVLVDSGLIRLEVLSIDGTDVKCKVIIPGPLGKRRHINLPGVRVKLPSLTKKDQGDVDVGVALGIEFFALSFVREPKDITMLKDYLEAKGSEAKVIAKIEDQQAITNLDEIIKTADGLMIARGDLGVECSFEELPSIQSKAIEISINETKPVIVATQMLESMIDSPMPTRAEISDIANAVREQTDCIMLSGETTIGKYPVDCVRTMNRIATRIEAEEVDTHPKLRNDIQLRLPKSKMLRSAAQLAIELEAAIVVFTRKGLFPLKLASLRPQIPIYAFTDQATLFRQLLLLRGIEPFYMDFHSDHETTIQNAFSTLKEKGWSSSGDPIVVVTKMYAGSELIDTTQIRTL
ncbi:MAG: pyruvate kinase [Puniceicoccaceae bacterium]|nr:pyruvate kinase [Puniceicoccaceae bacterium]RCL30464.1 MAG: pyruvate kinase [Puniceicoccaceae bacterium]